MKYLFFIVSINMLSIHAMQDVVSSQRIEDSYLSWLPKDIQDKIATYLWVNDMDYEGDVSFLERLRQSNIKPLQTAELGEGRLIRINKAMSLEIVDARLSVERKVIKSNCDNSLAFNELLHFQDQIYKDFIPENRVHFFALSPNKKKLVALVQNNRLDIYNFDDNQTTEKIDSFDLSIYYENEGSVPAECSQGTRIVWLAAEYNSRGYCTKKIYDKFSNLVYHHDYATQWYNPPKNLAISNEGMVLFCNDHQVFRLTGSGPGYEKIYETNIKDIGPYLESIAAKFMLFKEGNIFSMHFNKQGTQVGLIVNKVIEVLEDKKISPWDKKESGFLLTIEQYYENLKSEGVEKNLRKYIRNRLFLSDQSIDPQKKYEIISIKPEEKPTWKTYCSIKKIAIT